MTDHSDDVATGQQEGSENRSPGDVAHGVLTPVGSLIRRIRAPEDWTEEERQEALGELFFEGSEWIPYLKRFFTLIALSTSIAAFGLIADSTAVVIGAMLIAPLMTPMLAISAAVVYGRLDRIVVSGIVVLLGTVAAVLVGALVATVTAGTLTSTDLSGQILSRTSPSLLDLGIAVTAGMAAGYVLAHRKVGASLPGVAIAVALVPPLATIGVTLRLGATSEAQGAMLLYLTNLVAIVLSAGVVMVVSGFVPRHIRAIAKGHLTAGFVVSIVALVVISVPLAFHTVEQVRNEQLERLVVGSVPQWDESASVRSINVSTDAGRAEIQLGVATTGDPKPAWELAELIASGSSFDVDLTIRYQSELVDAASTR
ncbi:MAG: hypothetical protein BMS9Abin07_0142 [Acidimicrobiia bacterium]|nr:MAG: hypothetical protein BMS9Abin07_0142 [Acidimicrobiia bacterium]